MMLPSGARAAEGKGYAVQAVDQAVGQKGRAVFLQVLQVVRALPEAFLTCLTGLLAAFAAGHPVTSNISLRVEGIESQAGLCFSSKHVQHVQPRGLCISA
eukprot:1160126-Pelagomonas_calceolata.AAC.3